MTVLANGFEGGSDETTITTGNSGGASGDAFNTVQIDSGAVLVYDTAHAAHGTIAARVDAATSTVVYGQWTVSGSEFWGRAYIYLTANPLAGLRFVNLRTGASNAGGLNIGTSGKLSLQDAAGTNITTSTGTIPLNQWVRVEFHVIHSATVGQVEAKIFNTADATSPTETVSTSANLNTAASADKIRFGVCASNASNDFAAFWLDDIQVNTTGWPGPAITSLDISDTDSATLTDSGSVVASGGLLIAPTVLTEGNDATDATSYTTASVTPESNRLVLLSVWSGHTGGAAQAPSSVTGCGLTWVQIDTKVLSSGNQRVTGFRAMGTSPTTGAITISFAGTQHRVMWQVTDWANVDTTGTNGSGAIVQSNTSNGSGTAPSVTLPSAVAVGNATWGAPVVNVSTTVTAGSGYGELGSQTNGTSPSMTRFSEWAGTGSTTVNCTLGQTATWGMLGLEIAAPPGGGGGGGGATTKSDTDSFALDESGTVTVSSGSAVGSFCMAGSNYNAPYGAFETTAGKNVPYVRIFTTTFSLPPAEVQTMAVTNNRLVLWSVRPAKDSAGAYRWSKVSDGSQDTFIDNLGATLNGYGKEIVFIFGHEPHDNCSDLGGAGPMYGTSTEYRAAWSYIYNRWAGTGVLAKEGGNVWMGYCFGGPVNLGQLNPLTGGTDPCYPGGTVIDLLCHDHYNSGNTGSSFQTVWENIVKVAQLQGKRLLAGETGSMPSSGTFSRNGWIQDGVTWIKTASTAGQPVKNTMIGFCYWNSSVTGHDYRIVDSTGTTINGGMAAWQTYIAGDSFFLAAPISLRNVILGGTSTLVQVGQAFSSSAAFTATPSGGGGSTGVDIYTPIGNFPYSEASGVVASRNYANVYWVERDSGNPASLYAMKIALNTATGAYELGTFNDGTQFKTVTTDGTNFDWEDIAADSSGNIYIHESAGKFYRFPEVNPNTSTTTNQTALWTYSGLVGNNYSESSFWWNGSLYVVPERANNNPQVLYRMPATGGVLVDEGTISAPPVGWQEFNSVSGLTEDAPPHGADVSFDGKRVALVTYWRTWVWEGADPVDAVSRPPKWNFYHQADQTKAVLTEAVCFVNNNYDIITVRENGEIRYIPSSAYSGSQPGTTTVLVGIATETDAGLGSSAGVPGLLVVGLAVETNTTTGTVTPSLAGPTVSTLPLVFSFNDALVQSHVVVVRCDILRNGSVIGSLDVLGGNVQIDATAAVRRRCAVTVADEGDGALVPTTGFDLLSPYGNELALYRGLRYYDGSETVYPIGVFGITDVAIADDGASRIISISGYDRARLIGRRRFTDPYSIPAGSNYIVALETLLRTRMPELQTRFDTTTSVTPLLAWNEQSDPWKAAQDMARSLGKELFFDATGLCILRDEPDPAVGNVTWTYAEGDNATLISTTRRLTQENTYNYVVVTGEATANPNPFRGVAADNDPASPTSTAGPLGIIPYFYASPFITSNAQAVAAAQGQLKKVAGTAQIIELSAVPNPTHDAGDLVTIVRANSNINDTYVLDQLTIPLTVSDMMTATTRLRRSVIA